MQLIEFCDKIVYHILSMRLRNFLLGANMTIQNPLHDTRPQKGEFIKIYIPKEGCELEAGKTIDPGSGIVGFVSTNGLMAYFEGNRFGADNLKSWDSKVRHAYGRLVQKYPTIAKSLIKEELYECIGETDDDCVKVTKMDALNNYLSKSNLSETMPNSDCEYLGYLSPKARQAVAVKL